ncbi:MAG: 6-phosphogluconolactonase [Hyphomicrobiaceae bacterium]
MTVDIVEAVDLDTGGRWLAAAVASQLRRALRARGLATLALPGGRTPTSFITALGQQPLDWAPVVITLTDERFVPVADPLSNETMVRSALGGTPAAARLVGLRGRAATPEEAAAEAEGALAAARVPPLDVVVLGLGTDGHTASLFPGGDRLAEALSLDCRAIVLPMRAPGVAEPRLTLSAAALKGAAARFLLISGAEKRRTLQRALEDGPAEEMPIRAILRASGSLTVVAADA